MEAVVAQIGGGAQIVGQRLLRPVSMLLAQFLRLASARGDLRRVTRAVPDRIPTKARVAAAFILAVALTLGACGDIAVSDANGGIGPPTPDFGPPSLDVAVPDTGGPEAFSFDAGPELPSRFVPSDADFPVGVLKDAPGYVVPAEVIRKEFLAVSASQAAWVQVDIKGKRRLVTWDLFSGGPPQIRGVEVINPRDLAVSDDWLVWVDDTFDASGDIFALNLADGSDFLVVGAPNTQRRPAIRGAIVVWEDCRDCPADASKPAPELYRRDLDGIPNNVRLTDDTAMDRFPTLGTLADGTVAVAWLRGASTIRVLGLGSTLDASFATNGTNVEGVALAEGRVAFRAQPAIINPDSMIPTDPWAIEVATGAQITLATDQNITGKLPSAVVALADGRFAWLAQNPADPADATVVIADPATGATSSVTAPSAIQMVGGGGWVGFVAPRGDNGGETDVWLAPAP